VGDVVVESRAVDLASMGAVRRFAAELGSDLDRIDILFHIAGVLQTSPTRRLTVDGYEETVAVNALAPFLLTRLLLPLPARGAVSRPRRSVIRPPARRSPRAADHVAAVQPGQPVTVSSHAARRMHRLARRGRWADRPPHGGRIYRRTAGQAGETLRSRRRSRHARHGRGGVRRCP
jgi:NAD(P)-dependent dehydrogenase (short-subunit alcohol dehydrogenase family)